MNIKNLINEMVEEILSEKVSKIACLKCDEVSTAAAWQKKGGFCPKCKVSNQGVAESVELDEAGNKSLDPKWKEPAQRTAKEIKDQVRGFSDDTLKKLGQETDTKGGFNKIIKSKTRKMQDKLVDSELRRRGMAEELGEAELTEMKQPYVVIDTADGNKVVAMASSEKGAKQSIASSERPPMSIKDKNTLKLIKARKKQYIGYPLSEEVELDEKVELDHSRYMRSHGKKARGKGMWMFTSKDMGSPSNDEMVTVNGDLTSAAKEAAKKLGTDRVYVMEEVDLDEISNDLKKRYIAKAKDDVADRKKTISQANKLKNASRRNFHSHSLWMDVAYKNQDKNDSRKAMMAKAKDSMKVKKEEVELDEANKNIIPDRELNNLVKSKKAVYWRSSGFDKLPNDKFFYIPILDKNKKMLGVYKANANYSDQEYEYLDSMLKDVREEVELSEDIHNDLSDLIFDFQKKLMRFPTDQLDSSVAAEVKKLDKMLDIIRTGKLHSVRKGR